MSPAEKEQWQALTDRAVVNPAALNDLPVKPDLLGRMAGIGRADENSDDKCFNDTDACSRTVTPFDIGDSVWTLSTQDFKDNLSKLAVDFGLQEWRGGVATTAARKHCVRVCTAHYMKMVFDVKEPRFSTMAECGCSTSKIHVAHRLVIDCLLRV